MLTNHTGLAGVAKVLKPQLFLLPIIPAKEGIECEMDTSFEAVAKSIKALNHEGKEKLFFVLFLVPFIAVKTPTPD